MIANQERWGEMDFPGFLKRNSRENREPEVIACARHLRSKYEKVAGVGYCYGGSVVLSTMLRHMSGQHALNPTIAEKKS